MWHKSLGFAQKVLEKKQHSQYYVTTFYSIKGETMMKKLISMVMLPILLMISGMASAHDLKIGVLNMHQIIQQSPQAMKFRNNLRNRFQPRAEKIKLAANKIKQEENKLYRDGSVMSAAQRQTLQQSINKDRRELQVQQENLNQDVQIAQRSAMQKFVAIVNKDVQQLAQQKQYDLIVLNTAVPFVKQQYDVTPQVLAMMKKHA